MLCVSDDFRVNLDRPYGYIYVTHCTASDKFYIGKHKFDTTIPYWSNNLQNNEDFFMSHGFNMFQIDPNYLGSGKILHKAIQKYGIENFYIQDILDIAANENDLCDLETYYILEYRLMYGWDRIYNIADGGNGGDLIKNYSEEKQREINMKKVHYGDRNHFHTNPRIGELNGMYGKHHTNETKSKIRQSKIGGRASIETRMLMSKNRKNNPKFRPPSRKGKIVVNDGFHNKVIDPDELDNYLSNGFVHGGISYKKNKKEEDSQ